MLAWAVTFDLTITIPLLYYFVVIRTQTARPITIAPLFAACAAVAAMAIPPAYRQMLHDLRFLAAPLEVVTIVLLIRRIAAIKLAGAAADRVLRIDSAARQLLGDNLAAGVVASEVTVLSYALSGWRRKPDVPEGARSFTVHQKSGWSSVVACILVLIAAESLGAHLLLQLWSRRVAWIMTSLDLYGMLWVLGDFNALRLRPSLVTDDVLQIRYGLRWSLNVSREDIASARPYTAADLEGAGRRHTLRVAMIDEPRDLITLRSVAVARGFAGMRKSVTAIAIRADQEEVLAGWISGALRASGTEGSAGAARR